MRSMLAIRLRKLLRRGFLAAGIGGLAAVLAWQIAPSFVDLPGDLLRPQEVSTIFLARDGEPLRQLLNSDGERVSQPLQIGQISGHLIEATIATEDKRFYQHSGVDWLAILRAARSNFERDRIVSGASTITMQLVKNASPPQKKRTLAVKLREAIQARRLERSWSKNEILAAYLNRISYGNLFTGCSAAASGYFNKPMGDLTLAESAFLAALPQSPGRLNPFRDPMLAIARQKRILQAMRDNNLISDEQLQIALAQEIKLSRFAGGFEAPHATELAGEISSAAGGALPTTIDAALQRQVEAIITNRLTGLESRHVTHAAAVVIENRTGEVLALAGSRDFFAKDGGQINGAWSPHSPGSAIKPFTYLLAFERGRTPATVIADLPIEFNTATGIYRPENYDRRHYGPVTCRDALGNSLNIAAVKVLQQIGGAETLLAKLRELGISTLEEDAEHYGLGLTIGNAPVRLLELANAYACIARKGEWKPWRLIARSGTSQRSGEAPLQTISSQASTAESLADSAMSIFSPAECHLIADILSDNQARLLCFGAHSPLRLPFRVAAKTGTSSTYRDNWTLGFTPEFTVGVWAGNFDNTPMENVSGVTGAAPIFRDIFIELKQRFGVTWFSEPAEIVHARIDPRNGKRLGPQSPPARSSRDEIFILGKEPPFATAADYDPASGKAILPSEFNLWARSRDNWMGDLVTCGDSESAARKPLRILSPVPGTVVLLDPDIRDRGSRLMLQAEAGQEVRWTSPTLKLEDEGGRRFAILQPGRHEIIAADAKSGQSAKTWVQVQEE